MALTRITNEQEITLDGQISFFVVTKGLILLQWKNSLNEWVTAREFRGDESFVLAMETGVVWRFKIFGTYSYVESQL
jgi:hypothetical protein